MSSTRQRKRPGIVRPLDPADPRSVDHPSHDGQLLELVRALGRAMADQDFDRLHAGGGNEDSRGVLQVFDRPAKGNID
jgi:hypothetical protein